MKRSEEGSLPADPVRVHAVISGRVQGVGFRAATRAEARALGLSGWVRNLPDGTVELTAEGPRERVEALLKWCHDGPPFSDVRKVDADWLQATGEGGEFEVRRG